ncbi:MAG: GIY-YIG nuclease family protein [Patescibacteria group bacterium]
MKDYTYYVYILANQRNTVLYIGVTNNLIERAQQHKGKINRGFTQKYNADKLIYYEEYGQIGEAIYREKCLKKWNRKWKERLINEFNPNRRDLFEELIT